MPKTDKNKPKKPEGVRLTITLAEPVDDMIEELLDFGIFGTSHEEICERLVCEGLRRLMNEDFCSLDDDEDDE